MIRKIPMLLLAVISLAGCTKEETQVINPQEIYSAGGFIRGTVSGTRANGVAFGFPFEHGFLFEQDQFSYYEIYDYYRMSISRYPAANPTVNGYSDLRFTLFSPTPPYGVDEIAFDCDLYGDIGNGQLFNFSCYVNNVSSAFSSVNITNFIYNTSTRTASGNFTVLVDGDDNQTGNPAVISGSFESVPMLQVISRGTSNTETPTRPVN